MKASDVMVSTVITVGPDASVQDVAELTAAQPDQRRARGR
jgi:CBS domain-containing protein